MPNRQNSAKKPVEAESDAISFFSFEKSGFYWLIKHSVYNFIVHLDWRMSRLCHADFWMERLPQLLDLPVSLKAFPVAAVVCPAATAEPEYAI